ncbi:MAG: class I SAM-dependent methyltransferase [Oscillospiraceae bacterium]|jgi:SAM-dependent methyltransferase|nr:class I SAM-dependent methyltransferase [Oscillospiraceae bacterium]
MNIRELIKRWETEESHAFEGWDFSHLGGRWVESDPPWDYKAVVKSYLNDTDLLLDMGTGGGEVLLSIDHPYKNTYATEAYEPNFELCKEKLSALGITVIQTYNDEKRLDKLPFEHDFFDIIINRHESFDLSEVNRVLKRGGYFITQQVGNKNTCEFMQMLNDDFVFDRTSHTTENYVDALSGLGFQIITTDEVKYPIKVYDVGALVFMAKIIVWEYPGFSVNSHLKKLLDCQREIDEKGFLEATGHRFLIVAQKNRKR